MSFSVDVLANIAIELQRGIGHQDRFQRLITTLRQVLECDASALLRYDSRQFIPLAIDGLAKDVLGRRFALEGHPRLEAIARAGDVVRFPADSELPDPYDGLIPGQESLKVHACVGLPLFAGQNLIGALTLDGMQPDQFDVFSDEELRLIAALAAGALSNALLIEQLESQNMLPGDATPFEAVKQTQMIGLSPGMTQLKKEIEIVAASDLNVLISGETGTGKELVAKAIHEASPRAVNPLVYLNCAALPESVAESELFGHVKGAFTGAISNRSGKFEMADNGTLFLDERCSVSADAPTANWLIYGHNMHDGSMFGQLVRYRDEDFYKAHPTFTFDTLYEGGTWQVVAAVDTALGADTLPYYTFFDADTKLDWQHRVRAITEKALYDTGVMPEYGAQLLTLSTCGDTHPDTDARFALLAVRID